MGRSGVRHVILAVFGRLPVTVRIDAETRKVARMARPHPVVGIAAELTDRGRRSSHQTNVLEYLLDEHQILVSAEKVLNLHFLMLVVELGLFLDPLDDLRHLRFAVLLRQRVAQLRQNTIRNVADPANERHGQTRRRNLLLIGHRPETVLQVVVLDAAVALDRIESAMVVRQQQSPVRNDLAGAAVPENYDRIFDRVSVQVVNVLGRQLETLGLHVPDVQFLEIRQ